MQAVIESQDVQRMINDPIKKKGNFIYGNYRTVTESSPKDRWQMDVMSEWLPFVALSDEYMFFVR